MNIRPWFHHLAVLLLTLCCAAPGRADDIDIYYNQTANVLQPPATVIVLDLNLLGICDNVLTDTGINGGASYGTNNPLGATACFNLRTQTLTAYLTSIAKSPTAVLTSALTLLGPAGLCSLYTQLGLTAPTTGSGLLGLGSITTLSCTTLATIGSLVSGLVSTNFLNALIGGLLNPLLSTTLAALPTAVLGAVNSTLAGVGTILADPLSVANLFSVLGSILNNLVNTRVAIMVMHANRGNLTSNPSSYTGNDNNAYACQFNDVTYGATIGTAGTRSATQCSNGAYFLFGFRNLVDQTTISTLLTDIQTKLNSLLNPATVTTALTGLAGAALSSSSLTPPLQGKESYTEILHYLYGDKVYNGPLNKYDGLTALLTRDTTIESSGNYVSPQLNCKTVNVLNIDVSNTLAANDSDSDTDASANYFPGVTLRTPATSSDPDPGFTNMIAAAQNPGVTRNGNRINLNSYFVVQDNLSSLTALSGIGANVLNYASAAGLLGLGQSIAQFMQPVLVTDASLLTTSVATSRSTTTGLLTSAYVPEFRPKASRKPTWDGNVKRLTLQLNATTGVYSFVDATGASAIAADGRIDPAARTVWTNTAKIGSALADGRTTTLGGAGQNIPGYAFNGGGNPGRINNDGQRKLYYDQLSTTNVPSLGGLDADTQAVRDALKVDLGVTGTTTADDTTRRALLLQARGFDVGTTSAPKGTGSALGNLFGRPWLLGAVLHSRPVAVNYGARSGYTTAAPDVRVLFGSSDGFLHSVQNGTAATPSGVETWAFMPRATMRYLTTLRNDTYSADFPYGVDGAPSVLIIDRGTTTAGVTAPADGIIDSTNPNDHAYAFFGLRRGGSNYYGLDITNPDTPTLMWRIGTDGLYSANTASPGLATGSAAWFAELGQTFSTPTVGRISYTNSSNTVVQRSILLFAGGYNGGVDSTGARIGKDLHNSRNATTTAQTGVDETRGNALYMVDAVTGELIWKAVRSTTSTASYDSTTLSFKQPLLQDSIASDVTAVDSDGDGLTDRLYVGDTGGHVWRADFSGTDRSKWTASPIASLGRHGTTDTTLASDRRFFHAPDFVPARGPITTTVGTTTTTSTQNFDVVLIGSGDREDPFNTTTGNWLYAIRDRDITPGKTLTDTTNNGVITAESDARLFKQTDLTDLTTSCTAASTGICAAGVGLPNGWRLQLTGSGEKVVSPPVSINNTVAFSTYIPPSASTTRCVPDEGSGKVYGISLLDSRPYVQQFISDGDGAARSTVAKAPGIPGEVNALTPQALGVNSDTVNIKLPLTYRTFWRERREEEPERVKQ